MVYHATQDYKSETMRASLLLGHDFSQAHIWRIGILGFAVDVDTPSHPSPTFFGLARTMRFAHVPKDSSYQAAKRKWHIKVYAACCWHRIAASGKQECNASKRSN